MAAAQGVAQSTVSRHIERALEQLRDKLRAKGVLVALATLGAGSSQSTQSAPASVLIELGKMAVASSGTVAGTSAATALAGLKVKLAAAAVVVAPGIGGYMTYKHRESERSGNGSMATVPSTPTDQVPSEPTAALADAAEPAVAEFRNPPAAEPAVNPAPAPDSVVAQAPESPVGGANVTGDPAPAAQPMGFGGFGTRTAVSPPGPSRSPQLALHRFAMELRRGDLGRLERCVVPGSTEFTGFKRLLEKPQTDEERSMKQCLESLGQPVEILETTPATDPRVENPDHDTLGSFKPTRIQSGGTIRLRGFTRLSGHAGPFAWKQGRVVDKAGRSVGLRNAAQQ